LLVGLVWVGVDTLRGWVPFNGFAWGTLGAATVDIPWFASLARVAGEKAMTLAVVVLACRRLGTAAGARAGRDLERDGRVTWTGVRDGLPAGQIGTAWLVGTALVVTMATVEPPPASGSAEVLLVQPSDIRTFDGTGAERVATIARSAASLTSESIEADGLPDLVVWPESSIDADPSRFDAAGTGAARWRAGHAGAPGGRHHPRRTTAPHVPEHGPGGRIRWGTGRTPT
jgi:apolipoprotein N-acyltransferase